MQRELWVFSSQVMALRKLRSRRHHTATEGRVQERERARQGVWCRLTCLSSSSSHRKHDSVPGSANQPRSRSSNSQTQNLINERLSMPHELNDRISSGLSIVTGKFHTKPQSTTNSNNKLQIYCVLHNSKLNNSKVDLLK